MVTFDGAVYFRETLEAAAHFGLLGGALGIQVVKHTSYLFIAREAGQLHLLKESVDVTLQFSELVLQKLLLFLGLLLAGLVDHLVLPHTRLDLVLDLLLEPWVNRKFAHHLVGHARRRVLDDVEVEGGARSLLVVRLRILNSDVDHVFGLAVPVGCHAVLAQGHLLLRVQTCFVV